MAVPAAVPLGVLALLFVASSSDKANAATPVAPPGGEPPLPPPGPPPGGGPGTEVLTPPAVAALTEVRQVDGRPVRYFKATAQQAVVAQLASHGLQPVPSPVTGGAAFRLVPLAAGGASAATALTASAQQGLVIAANLAIITPSASLRYVVVLPRPQIGAISPSS
ncbi:MAG: hypothetical protein R3B72_51915, partial [Polyangiaceae bacterium]